MRLSQAKTWRSSMCSSYTAAACICMCDACNNSMNYDAHQQAACMCTSQHVAVVSMLPVPQDGICESSASTIQSLLHRVVCCCHHHKRLCPMIQEQCLNSRTDLCFTLFSCWATGELYSRLDLPLLAVCRPGVDCPETATYMVTKQPRDHLYAVPCFLSSLTLPSQCLQNGLLSFLSHCCM